MLRRQVVEFAPYLVSSGLQAFDVTGESSGLVVVTVGVSDDGRRQTSSTAPDVHGEQASLAIQIVQKFIESLGEMMPIHLAFPHSSSG